jgi:hypothetical protein
MLGRRSERVVDIQTGREFEFEKDIGRDRKWRKMRK